jgi:isopenicillin N synthase-like dioxygenase
VAPHVERSKSGRISFEGGCLSIGSGPSAVRTRSRVPEVDLEQFAAGKPGREKALEQLRAVAHDSGAFYLVGHGVEGSLFESVYAVARRLFELPRAELDAIAMLESPHFRGYTRVGDERTQGQPDLREQLDVGFEHGAHRRDAADYYLLDGPNQWPEALPELAPVILGWMRRLQPVAARLLSAVTESLGLDPNVFATAFSPDPYVNLKIVHYPARSGDSSAQGVGSHKDYGFLTLLIQDGVGGLQILVDGEFVDVVPKRDALVVNLGEMLEIATNGFLTATVHRVVSPPAGVDRISVPYFYNPRLDYTVAPLNLPEEFAREARLVPDASNPIFAEFGRNAMRGWFRSHPTVAQRHHAALVRRCTERS